MINYKNASKRIKKAAAIAVIAVFAQPSATGHPFSSMMEAYSLVGNGALFKLPKLGGLNRAVTLKGIEDATGTAVNIYVEHCDGSPATALSNFQNSGARLHCDGTPESQNYAEFTSLVLCKLLARHAEEKIQRHLRKMALKLQKQLEGKSLAEQQRLRERDTAACQKLQKEYDEKMQELRRTHELRNWRAFASAGSKHNARKDIRLYWDGLGLDPYMDVTFEIARGFRKQYQRWIEAAEPTANDEPGWAASMSGFGKDASSVEPEKCRSDAETWVANRRIIDKLTRCLSDGHRLEEQWQASFAPLVAHPEMCDALFHGEHLRPSSVPQVDELFANATRAILARLMGSKNTNPDMTLPMSAIRLALARARDDLMRIAGEKEDAAKEYATFGASYSDADGRLSIAEDDMQLAREAYERASNAAQGHPVHTYLAIREALHRAMRVRLQGRYAGADATHPETDYGTPSDSSRDGRQNEVKDRYRFDVRRGCPTANLDAWYAGVDPYRDDSRVELDLDNRCLTQIGVPTPGKAKLKDPTEQSLPYPRLSTHVDMIDSLNGGRVEPGSMSGASAGSLLRQYLQLPAEPAFVVDRWITPDKQEYSEEDDKADGPQSESTYDSRAITIKRGFRSVRRGQWSGGCLSGGLSWGLWMTIHSSPNAERCAVKVYEEEPEHDAQHFPILDVSDDSDESKPRTVMAIYRVRDM
jgi:hypothetical protein